MSSGVILHDTFLPKEVFLIQGNGMALNSLRTKLGSSTITTFFWSSMHQSSPSCNCLCLLHTSSHKHSVPMLCPDIASVLAMLSSSDNGSALPSPYRTPDAPSLIILT